MSEFKKLMENSLGEDVYFGTQKGDAWDTGVYAVNKALGGGVYSGRMHLWVGKESTGKSTLAAKLSGNVNATDYKTGQHCDPKSGKGCKVLYVDAEGTLDHTWCEVHNYFPNDYGNLVLSTNTGNQAIDVVNAAIQSGEFSLILLDSLEALIPFKDLEKSSEDFVMGTKAKMNNAAYRVWQVSMNATCRNISNWWQRPTFVAINQLRDTISKPGQHSPPTIPGGIGQKQFSSSIVQMNAASYADDGKLCSKGTFKGVVKKNKLATPRIGFEYEMALRDLEDMKLGEVDNVKSIIQDVRRHRLWTKKDDKLWWLFDYSAKKQDEFSERMREDPNIELDIMRKVIEELNK